MKRVFWQGNSENTVCSALFYLLLPGQGIRITVERFIKLPFRNFLGLAV